MPWGRVILALMVMSLRRTESFPNNKLEDIEEDVQPDDFDLTLLEDETDGKNASECDRCSPELCPVAAGCRAGVVLDSCGCCPECGNLEGQSCDLDSRNSFYGVCGSDLQCKIDISDLGRGEVPEPQCVCKFQEAVCGSDGRTYMNICQFKEAAFSTAGLSIKGNGPCQTVPLIKVPPHNIVNATGSSMSFLCEVFAYPMALIEWRKDGNDVILPGDDPHISVQSRGGPMKYELSSWLQIEDLAPGDAGTYRCVAHNAMGSVSASAVLGVLGPDEMSAYLSENMSEMFGYDHSRDYDEDYY
ncbi:kazal-type serine peptidase inhibitor domain 3 [Megalops cyprinoides]|uniref:kazal-type serine peptidase inhibitor domain 3 n=1 Tax=Megalops cyprinoides TaxID=118141 RepID=UPI001863E18D|nr:kazal-type serine peptidase inhibitor domain 3 [Megalops cyprinoides]